MLKSARRFLAATIAGLASHQFSHAAPPVSEAAQVMSDAECALKEIEYDHGAVSVRPEILAKYAGEMTPLTPALLAQVRASKKWRNSCVTGREEYDRFIEERTK